MYKYALVLSMVFSLQVVAKQLTGQEVAKLAAEVGLKYGIEPELLQAIAKVESNYNAAAVGRSHKEVGLMQLHPAYFQASFEPKANMEMAANHLKKLEKVCKKRGEAWFTCYNSGIHKQVGDPTKLQYYKKVTYVRNKLRREASTRYMVSNANQWRLVDNLFSFRR